MRDGVKMLRCSHDVHSQSVHVRRRSGKSPSFGFSQVVMYAYLCVPLTILSLSGVERHDCVSPSFAVLGERWVELVLFQIAPHSVHIHLSLGIPRGLPPSSLLHVLLRSFRLFSSHGQTTKGVSGRHTW